MSVFRKLPGDDEVGSFTLSVIYERLPEDVKKAILWPYISEDGDQTRLAARIYETKPNLDRDAMLNDIQRHIKEDIGIAPEDVHLTGVFVLYSNVLRSLLESQLKTAGVVIVLVFLMFTLTFRSIRVAVISLAPNLLGAAFVLAVMGVLSMPLDIMTITIAAIAIGIGVDDTIHYVYRYREEIIGGNDADAAIRQCHKSVGLAIVYTTVTIVLGFSVLSLSNFVPTLYFGLLTALAMVIALAADLTLLPSLLKKTCAFET